MKIGRYVFAGILSLVSASAASFLGPTPYLSFGDSPFNGAIFSNFVLQNFESASLPLTGVTITPGVGIGAPSGFSDSVDGDDGAIDGSGAAGRALYSGFATSVIRFTFDASAFGGQLPTHAGVVWTDVGQVTGGTIGTGPVTFEAFGPGLVSLGSIGPFTLGDGSALSATAEDRFFGVIEAGGVQAIEIRMGNSLDWEVDHLQFGFAPADTAVPEPSTTGLVVLAGLAMTGLRGRLGQAGRARHRFFGLGHWR